MKLLLTRHGQSRWQTDGDSAGHDSPLSPLGVVQAHRLGHFLQEREQIARIIASDLRRAHATASVVATYLNLPVMVEPDLREFDSWEAGHPPRPTAIDDPTPAETEHPEHLIFRARVGEALQRIVSAAAKDETVLVVAHGGTVGTALRLLTGASVARIWTPNTALHGLRWKQKGYWVIRYVNRLEHLPRALRSW